jgi:hypothetical protein
VPVIAERRLTARKGKKRIELTLRVHAPRAHGDHADCAVELRAGTRRIWPATRDFHIGGDDRWQALVLGLRLGAFSLVLFERLEQVVDHPRLQHTLDGVAGAAVGIIAATLVQLALSAWQRLENPVVALPIFTLAALAAWRVKGKWVTPAIVAVGAAAGAVLLG